MIRPAFIPALTLAAVPATASAATDRNHDGLPDRWERQHHLSLSVKQARRDTDHDGLKNRGEYRAGTDPRDRDSDDAGRRDGAENMGTVASFAGGVLKVRLAGGGTLTGRVTAATRLRCDDDASASAVSDDHGRHGGGGGEVEPGDDNGGGGGTEPGDDSGGHGNEPGDDNGGHGTEPGGAHAAPPPHPPPGGSPPPAPAPAATRPACSTDALKAGVRLSEAQIRG